MNLYDNFGVFEVGMSKFNEINKLSALVKPHIAMITNISEAHLENFKNIQGIAKAKSEIIIVVSLNIFFINFIFLIINYLKNNQK